MTTQNTQTQILARLIWASHLGSWTNIHPQMRPAVVGLVRRGLMERRESDNALRLTDAGAAYLESAGLPLNMARENAVGTADKLVPTAKFWTDSWGQHIPE
jgi:hypothetical protein